MVKAFIATMALAAAFVGQVHAATILVNTTVDEVQLNDACSLREAMVAAGLDQNFGGCTRSGGGADDVIQFDLALFTPLPTFAFLAIDSGTLIQQGSNNVRLEAPAGRYVLVPGDGTGPVITLNQTSGTFELTRIRLSNGSSAASGGGIRVIGGTRRITMDNLRIENSDATGDGGAIGLESATPLVIEAINDTWFTGNTAGGSGGVIGGPVPTGAAATQLRIDLLDAYVSGNQAGGYGGAISVIGPTPAIQASVNINVDGTWFNSNEGANGGAISVRIPPGASSVNSVLDIRNSEFTGNEANACGGAIFLINDAGGPTNSILADIEDNRFEGNFTGSGSPGNPCSEDDGSGGAIRIQASSLIQTGRLSLNRNSFLENSTPGNGGAVSISHAFANMVNNLLASNSAGRTGGGLFVNVSLSEILDQELWFLFNTFYQNTAGSASPDPAGWNQSIAPASPDTSSVIRTHGNAYVPAEGVGRGPSDADCLWVGIGFRDRQYNIGGHFSCADAPTELLANPNTPLQAITHPVHTMAALPASNSPVIDFVPEAACSDEFGVDLAVDMLDVRRVGGVPIEGDGIPPADCDAGSIEAPEAPVTGDIFRDGFED